VSTRKRRFIQRSRLDIIACILTNAEQGSRKTRLIYQCNLSVSQFNKYATSLLEGALLETKVSGNRIVTYYTTPKGKEFLQDYHKIHIVLETMGF
jgi:predicted transcriptional regulator